ncbi:MAG: ArnT family glycosyltransferase, partial [Candidatus Binatia bacterium]
LAGAHGVYDDEWWPVGEHFMFGFTFMYGAPDDPLRRDPDERLMPARYTTIALGVLLGLVVFAWARGLWGERAGLVALVLYCFSPTVLAHTRLATTDLPIALGYVATLWCAWRLLRAPSLGRTLLVGLALGAALTIKFSALLLPPTLAALWVLWALWAPRGERRRRWAAGAAALVAIGAVAVVVIWAVYGFRYSISPDATFRPDPRWPVAESGSAVALVRAAMANQLLPESYLYGLLRQMWESGRQPYLNGRLHDGGVWYYFPEAFLLKSTPSLLVLLPWLGLAALYRTRGRSFDGWCVALPALLYAAFAVSFAMNIGHRHILPLYPLLFVLLGGAAVRAAHGPRVARWALAVLLAGQVVSGLWSAPRYLSYFNLLAGGPAGGRYYLSDSNLDWGQDLKRLREKMEEHGLPSVYLLYFGTADPHAYGIAYRKVRMFYDFHRQQPDVIPPPGSVVAASLSLMQLQQFALGLLELEPFDMAGDSIYLYRLPAQ